MALLGNLTWNSGDLNNVCRLMMWLHEYSDMFECHFFLNPFFIPMLGLLSDMCIDSFTWLILQAIILTSPTDQLAFLYILIPCTEYSRYLYSINQHLLDNMIYLIRRSNSMLHVLFAGEKYGSHHFSHYIQNIMQIIVPPQPITDFLTYIQVECLKQWVSLFFTCSKFSE